VNVTALVAQRSDAPGRYDVTYTALVSGRYIMSAALGNVVIVASPYTVQIVPALTSAQTTSLFYGLANGTEFVNSEFLILARDAFGNINVTGASNFYVRLWNHNGTLVEGTVVAHPNAGNYSVLYNATVNGEYTLTVRLASDVQGLHGAYFNNRWLKRSAVLERVDKFIDFDWGTDLITPTAKDYVSVRWTGFIKSSAARGTHGFQLTVDDGARLYITGILVIDEWLSEGAAVYTGSYFFNLANVLYDIRLEYRETAATAHCTLSWLPPASTGASAYVVVPSAALFSSAQHIVNSPFTFHVHNR
jgi:hypothetical protein